LITVAYALGAAVPMLAIAYGGRAAASGLQSFRAHAQTIRVGLGVVIAASAFLIVFHVDRTLQTKIGDYTSALQHTEKSCYARRNLGYRCNREQSRLADFGAAPDFRGISDWFNSKPLSMAQLRGKRGPPKAQLVDTTPTEVTTPETYLGYGHALADYVGSKPVPDGVSDYKAPKDVTQNGWALSGRWRLGREHTTAVRAAELALHFHAKAVYLVMGGRGRVGVEVDGHALRTIAVKGISR